MSTEQSKSGFRNYSSFASLGSLPAVIGPHWPCSLDNAKYSHIPSKVTQSPGMEQRHLARCPKTEVDVDGSNASRTMPREAFPILSRQLSHFILTHGRRQEKRIKRTQSASFRIFGDLGTRMTLIATFFPSWIPLWTSVNPPLVT